MRTVGRVLRFKGAWQGTEAELDLAGKVMGYQSYGEIIPWFYEHSITLLLKTSGKFGLTYQVKQNI